MTLLILLHFYIKELRDRLDTYKPKAVIITPMRIVAFVKSAIAKSSLNNIIDKEMVYPLYFAGNSWQNKYMSGLRSSLTKLISIKIILPE